MLNWVKKLINNNNPSIIVSEETGKPRQSDNGEMSREESIDSCEAMVEEQRTDPQRTLREAKNKFDGEKVIIARLLEMGDKSATWMTVDGKELRVTNNNFVRLLPEPKCGQYYTLEGTFSEGNQNQKLFKPNSVVELKEGSKALLMERDALGESLAYEQVEKGIELLAVNIFNSDCVNISEKENTPIMKDDQPESNIDGETIKHSNSTSSGCYESCVPTNSVPSTASFIMEDELVNSNKQIVAVVLGIDTAGNVRMFSPDQNDLVFFEVSGQSLDDPLSIGNWYLMCLSLIKDEAFGVPIFDQKGRVLAAEPEKGFQTRLSNGTVQIFVEVSLDSQAFTDLGCFCCRSSSFPPVLDTGGLLNVLNLERNDQNAIRNALSAKIGIWCGIRKYPIGGIYWKVMGLDRKLVKKRKKAREERQRRKEEEEIGKKKETEKKKMEKQVGEEEVGVGKQQQNEATQERSVSRKGLSADGTGTNAPSIRNAPPLPINKLSEEMDGHGLICSQTESDFLVFNPKGTFLLDKRKCRDRNILGFWIKFQARRDNRGTMYIESYRFIEPKIYAIPTHNYVLLRCWVQIPRPLESDELPWCDQLRVNVTDEHALIRNQHLGKNVRATVGTPACCSSANQLQWQLLNIDEI